MVKLSAVIPVKNEEEKIEKCLNSLRNFVDEVIIVNNLSSDRTEEICKRCGAKVITHELEEGNFNKQRNIGIENATGEWILQMDADEIVPVECANKIRQNIENPRDYVAFRVFRRNFFLGYPLCYAGTYDYMLKIFKKDKACYIGNNVHESLKIDGPVGDIDAQVNHYPFNSIAQVMEKCNFYSELESEVFLKSNSKISIKEIKQKLTWKSLKLFWKLYIKKRGYKDGMHGLAWCILNVIGPQVRWLKIWEKAVKEGKLAE